MGLQADPRPREVQLLGATDPFWLRSVHCHVGLAGAVRSSSVKNLRHRLAWCVLVLCAGLDAWIYWPLDSSNREILNAGGTLQVLTVPEHQGRIAISLPDTLSDRDLKQMDALEKLQPAWLQLRGRRITGQSLRRLQRLPCLCGLILNNTSVEDTDLVLLHAFPKLESLMLDGSPITDKGLRYIEPLPSLKSVSLMGTGVSAKGVHKLQAERPDLQVLSSYTCRADEDCRQRPIAQAGCRGGPGEERVSGGREKSKTR